MDLQDDLPQQQVGRPADKSVMVSFQPLDTVQSGMVPCTVLCIVHSAPTALMPCKKQLPGHMGATRRHSMAIILYDLDQPRRCSIIEGHLPPARTRLRVNLSSFV